MCAKRKILTSYLRRSAKNGLSREPPKPPPLDFTRFWPEGGGFGMKYPDVGGEVFVPVGAITKQRFEKFEKVLP